MAKIRGLGLTALLALILAACGADDGGVSIEGAWARPSPQMADAGAVYMQLTSDADDRLVGASVDPSVAAVVEVHETVMAGMGDETTFEDDGMSDEEGMGAMMMREVGEIALPAGDTVSLEPGGLHIMLMQLAEPLEVGATFDLALDLEGAGEVTVEVEVREEAP